MNRILKYSIKDKITLSLLIFLPICAVIGNFALNLNILLLISLFLFVVIFESEKKNYKCLYYLIFIILFLIFNNLNSYDLKLSIKGSVGFLKNILLLLSLVFFFKKKNFLENFIKYTFFFTVFCSIDTLIQFYYGVDIFGFAPEISHGYRLSGPFGDEYVIGAFISKIAFITILYLINKKKDNLTLIFLSFFLIIIFISKERSAFIVFFFAYFFYIIFSKTKLKKKFLFIFIFLSLIISVLTINKSFYNKYILDIKNILGLQQKTFLTASGSVTTNSYNDSRYAAHFLTAYEIFKDYPLFGSGIKTFRKVCSDQKYESINSNFKKFRCNTHPHNIYFEVLSETGILGFFLFLLFIIYISVKSLLIYLKSKSNENLINLCLIFILFFPFQTTGSLFSTFNGFFYPLILSVILCNLQNLRSK